MAIVYTIEIFDKEAQILNLTTNGFDVIDSPTIYKSFVNIKELVSFDEAKLSIEVINQNAVDVLSNLFDYLNLSSLIKMIEIDSNGLMINTLGRYRYYISSLEFKNNICILSLDPLIKKLNIEIGSFFSSTCRADFCDSKCKLNIENFRHSATIEGIISNTIYKISNISLPSSVSYGFIRFRDNGIRYQIIKKNNDEITLLREPNESIKIGQLCDLYQNCDKTTTMCECYGNIINFRGEPFIIDGN